MIGIFDSGAGGEHTLRLLRKLLPSADIVFLADRENAPYGTKDEKKLVLLVREDVRRLRAAGASEILIGCCTASTVYEHLTDEERHVTHPIIEPTARAAAFLTRGHVGVIATEATVRSHAFERALRKLAPGACVHELAVQELVSMIESGVTDHQHTKNDEIKIQELIRPLLSKNIDTLILGCTHFPLVSGIISKAFGNARIVSSAYEGAREMAHFSDARGSGQTIYL